MFTSIPLIVLIFIVASITIVARILISQLDNEIDELKEVIVKLKDTN